ncbi:hypothetical protein KL86DES1_21790 [uncultured Desulfovibrio sp.]|uniref:Uncharacterized protein n=1 Tax=uncultured Desulfovibrio sp. TaxID=167968 RepID=A0A212L9N9_9BACT|nr:hypothetical protein KL86DES1_21790 [uncultured Desulfovibrio sp.]VZH34689.1 conserved protein of unknown function [Desulfovibrio sp. 86]
MKTNFIVNIKYMRNNRSTLQLYCTLILPAKQAYVTENTDHWTNRRISRSQPTNRFCDKNLVTVSRSTTSSSGGDSRESR